MRFSVSLALLLVSVSCGKNDTIQVSETKGLFSADYYCNLQCMNNVTTLMENVEIGVNASSLEEAREVAKNNPPRNRACNLTNIQCRENTSWL